MPRFSGKFEYLGAPPSSRQEGACELSFDATTLTIASRGAPIAFDLGDIDAFEAGEYEIRLSLCAGAALRLTHFGKAFQDLAHQLLDAFRDRLVRCLLVSDLDEAARFEGCVRLQSPARPCEGPAQLRLYETNLAVLPDGSPGFQWRLAEIEAFDFDAREYTVVLRRRGERLLVSRLAKRTGELVDRLREQASVLEERAARVLHALFPFLTPDQFRTVAARLREGASVPIAELRPVHRLIEPSLLERIVDPALRPYLRALVARSAGGNWRAGFKIVRKDAEPDGSDEGEPEADVADPVEGDAGPVPEARGPDAAVTEAGDGLEALYWFFFPLRAGSAAGDTHVAWEATSRGGRATYLFRLAAGARESIDALTDGLVALNFRREPVYLPADTLACEPRYRHYAIALRKVPEVSRVQQAFAGRAIHRSLPAWSRQLDTLLDR